MTWINPLLMLLRASLQLREIKELIIAKSISCWSGISMLSQFLLSRDRYLHPSGELDTRAGHQAVPAGSDPGLSRGECPCPRSANSFLVRKAKRKEELVGKLSWPRGCSSPGSTVLAGVFHLCSIFPPKEFFATGLGRSLPWEALKLNTI